MNQPAVGENYIKSNDHNGFPLIKYVYYLSRKNNLVSLEG